MKMVLGKWANRAHRAKSKRDRVNSASKAGGRRQGGVGIETVMEMASEKSFGNIVKAKKTSASAYQKIVAKHQGYIAQEAAGATARKRSRRKTWRHSKNGKRKAEIAAGKPSAAAQAENLWPRGGDERATSAESTSFAAHPILRSTFAAARRALRIAAHAGGRRRQNKWRVAWAGRRHQAIVGGGICGASSATNNGMVSNGLKQTRYR